MKNPICKDTDSPLSHEEDEDISARLAAAYKEYDEGTDDPETQSIIRLVEEKLRHPSTEADQN